MKKRVISIIAIISLFTLLFPITISAKTNDFSGGELLKEYVLEEKSIEDEMTSTDFLPYEEAVVNAEYVQSYIDSNKSAKQTYGGCYIDDNNKLHLLFVDGVEEKVLNTVNMMVENDVIYETCKYTFDELLALKKYIENCLCTPFIDAEVASVVNDISVVGIYEQTNNVFVGINDCTNEKIDIFKKKIYSSDAIIFENFDEYKEETSVNPGGVITTADNAFSTGFRCAVMNSSGSYINGFVTAGHGVAAGDAIYFCGAYLGYVQSRVYGGYVDAAFVYITNTGCQMTNTTFDNARTLNGGTYVNSFATGATVYKDGFVTGETSGKITSTSVSTRGEGGTVISDCVMANYDSSEGDSGGVVFMYTDSKYHVAGIHRGSAGSSAVFVKVKRIKEALEVVLY